MTEARLTFIQALKSLRQKKGVTQKQLAQRLKVTQSWVSRFESGKHDYTFSSVIAYLFALNPEFELEFSIQVDKETVATASTDLSKLLK